MTGLVVLFVALLFLSLAISVWRIVTLPRRVARSVRSVRTAVGLVQQRQADKAAGRPVAPINVLALTGMVLALGGIIVARTTSAITGLGMIVIGMGVILVGSRMATLKRSSTDQRGGYPQVHSGCNPSAGSYPAPPTIGHTVPASSAAFDPSQGIAGPPQQPSAPAGWHALPPVPEPPAAASPVAYPAFATGVHPTNGATAQRGMTPRNWVILAGRCRGPARFYAYLVLAVSPRSGKPTTAASSTAAIATFSAAQEPTFTVAPAPTASPAPPPVSDADAHGFAVFGSGARCFNSDAAVMFMRTDKSALVVCRSEISRLYYRGYRLSDGARIDLYDVSPQSGGFVAVNSADNARYVISPSGFQLIQNGDVVKGESAVEVGP